LSAPVKRGGRSVWRQAIPSERTAGGAATDVMAGQLLSISVICEQ
jgi:hypothetical protein